MKFNKPLLAAVLLMFFAQSCKTTSRTVSTAKKPKMPPKITESFVLMDESEEIDREILRRGNKARGLSEY